MYAKPYGDFAKITRSTKTGTSVYLGYRQRGRYGFELGHNWTDRNPRLYTSKVGDKLFGATETRAQTYKVKLRLKETYFDVHAHLPLSKSVEAKLAIGVGYVRWRFKSIPNGNNGPVDTAIASISGKTNVTTRLAVGLQAMATERTGLRFMVKYQTTSNVKANNMPNNANQRAMNNSVSAVLGIFWTFTPLSEKTDPSYKGEAVMGAPR